MVESTGSCLGPAFCCRAAKAVTHTPLCFQREKRTNIRCHGPNRSGRSRHGTPHRSRHSTASINRRVSFAVTPGGGYGLGPAARAINAPIAHQSVTCGLHSSSKPPLIENSPWLPGAPAGCTAGPVRYPSGPPPAGTCWPPMPRPSKPKLRLAVLGAA